MKILIDLFIAFFKIGLFSVGGGLAMIPLIQEEVFSHQWLSQREFVDMIAIAQVTPAPIAPNMATYVGFLNAGIWGSLTATVGVAAPSVIILVILSRYTQKFGEKKIVKAIFAGLKPMSVGLIGAAAIQVAGIGLFDMELFKQTGDILNALSISGMIIAVIVALGGYILKIHPILLIFISGLLGILMM